MVSVQEYYDHPSVSQSELKLIGLNPKLYQQQTKEADLYFEEKKHFIIGSAVDCLLTRGATAFNEEYHISDIENKPSDTIKSIVNQVFDIVKENRFDSNDDIGMIQNYLVVILECCNTHDYNRTWKDDTKVAKVCEAWEYWEDLKKALGKTVLSVEESGVIYNVVMSLKSNEATKDYFEENTNETKLFQVPLYFEYNGVNCKALLDLVIFNHHNKTIQPIDIKTIGDHCLNFPKSVRQRRYDIQAAFYTAGLQKRYPECEILPFKFIVESTIDPGTPLVFTCSEDLLHIGKVGRPELILGDGDESYSVVSEIRGFEQLLDLYSYYQENGFDTDRLIKENKSELTIDWSGIITE
jgi:hypothetical protein